MSVCNVAVNVATAHVLEVLQGTAYVCVHERDREMMVVVTIWLWRQAFGQLKLPLLSKQRLLEVNEASSDVHDSKWRKAYDAADFYHFLMCSDGLHILSLFFFFF